MLLLEILICLAIVIWTLGKALWSIPSLYKDSKKQKGADLYGNLVLLIGFRVIAILVLFGVLTWLNNRLGLDIDLKKIPTAIFVALFFSGLASFFVLLITFLLAKLAKTSFGDNDEDDILDSK